LADYITKFKYILRQHSNYKCGVRAAAAHGGAAAPPPPNQVWDCPFEINGLAI
jgi:hypothetical protein